MGLIVIFTSKLISNHLYSRAFILLALRIQIASLTTAFETDFARYGCIPMPQSNTSTAFGPLLREHAPDYKPYEDLYRHFHTNAELSRMEHKTAAKVAETLKSLSPDIEITTGIGGTGLTGILRNGKGKTVLLRADMDGLPVQEQTGLDYACTKKMEDDEGETRCVMHACGHDMHVTALLAASETLVSSRKEWSGTLVLLFQPAEEKMTGAKAMVRDGLYEKHGCPVPDVLLGQHVLWGKAGSVYTRPGALMTAADGLTIRVYGRGGHGSQPHRSIDPAVLASHIVLRLQNIVSREVPPGELAVVTVGSVHVGSASNIIGDEAVLQVSTRSVSEHWRSAIHAAIRRVVKAECEASNSPRDPEFDVLFETSVVDNDSTVTEAISDGFRNHFGDMFDPDTEVLTASEDFGDLAHAVKRPYCYWFFGGHEPEDWERLNKEGKLGDIPTNHSPFFAPVVQPTLRTGTEALVVGALTFLGKGKGS